MITRPGKIAAGVAAVALAAAPALAEKAAQLTSLNGQSASSAEQQLANRGFKHFES